MIYIIGSGPASIASLAACVEKKVKVTIIDIGFTADSNFKENNLKKSEKSNIPVKTIFGSNYPYWDVSPKSYKRINRSDAMNSHAKGGFSNTWGAGILPYTKEEFKDWPITYETLSKYYKKLESFLPMVTKHDLLEEDFPLFHSNHTELKASSQFYKIFKRVNKNKEALISKGIFIGKSRLAINQKQKLCSYCSKCIEGCPDYLIYSAAYTLNEFIKLDNVNYIDGIQVEKIASKNNIITIDGYDLKNKKSVSYQGNKVFVGCGALSSTQIMMRSLKIYNKEVTIKDSQYFIFPMLGMGSKNILKEDVFALSEAFCEIKNKTISPHRIHLSLYGFSPFLKDYIYSFFGRFSSIFKPVINFFLKRLYIAQGFIHSDNSNQISLMMVKNETDTIIIKPKNTIKIEKGLPKIVRFLNKNYKKTSLFGFSSFLQTASTGKSFHIGGSMPMKKQPKSDLETNTFGETNKLPNVHIIDSSIFPNIPAGPMSYTMMANSYRITIKSLK